MEIDAGKRAGRIRDNKVTFLPKGDLLYYVISREINEATTQTPRERNDVMV